MPAQEQKISNRVLTVPNVISCIRLCLIPVFVAVLFCGHGVVATFIYAFAASSDFLDGYIARRTNAVSRLGKLLDPFVDRMLLVTGVICLLILGRLPVWIIVLVVVRDLVLVAGDAHLVYHYGRHVDVIMLGKVATTLLYIGFAGLMLNIPQVAGIHLVDASWLPGLNGQVSSWGIWFVYAGLAVSLISSVYYICAGVGIIRHTEKASVGTGSERIANAVFGPKPDVQDCPEGPSAGGSL